MPLFCIVTLLLYRVLYTTAVILYCFLFHIVMWRYFFMAHIFFFQRLLFRLLWPRRPCFTCIQKKWSDNYLAILIDTCFDLRILVNSIYSMRLFLLLRDYYFCYVTPRYLKRRTLSNLEIFKCFAWFSCLDILPYIWSRLFVIRRMCVCNVPIISCSQEYLSFIALRGPFGGQRFRLCSCVNVIFLSD